MEVRYKYQRDTLLFLVFVFCISALNKTKGARCQYLMKEKELSVSVVKEQCFVKGKICFHRVNVTFYRFAGSGDSGKYLIFAWQTSCLQCVYACLQSLESKIGNIISNAYSKNDPKLHLFLRRNRRKDIVLELRLM